jgi:hypothetical protein
MLNGVCRAGVRGRQAAFLQLFLAGYGAIMRDSEVVASILAGDHLPRPAPC